MNIFKIVIGLLVVFSFALLGQTTRQVPEQYSTIQAALNAAQPGDTVLVQPGVYHENIIWPDVNNIKLFSSAGYKNTIIDGNQLGSVISIIDVEIDTNTIIQGFSFSNGGSVAYGGGICNSESTIKLIDLLIENNQSSDYGGGIYSGYYSKTIIESSIIRNNESGYGGGIYCLVAAIFDIDNTIIEENLSKFGGGLYLNASKTILSNSIIRYNRSSEGAGAFCVTNGEIYATNTSVYNNRNSHHASLGIIYLWENNGSIENCNIYNNDSTNTCIVSGSRPVKILNCNIYGNNQALFNLTNTNRVNAVSNYWGSMSGPYHQSLNIEGQGDSIGLHIDFLPYLTSPDTSAPPLPVQNIEIVNASNNAIGLHWDSSMIADLKGYKVYWSHSLDGQYENSIDVGNQTSFTVSGLTSGVTYYFVVTSYDNSNNESVHSEVVAARTTPPILRTKEDNLHFPETVLYDSLTIALHIISANESPLQIISISNSDSSFFCNIASPTVVPGLDTLEAQIFFKPTQYGSFMDTLILTTTGGIKKIPMRGNSPYPTLSENNTNLSFGTVIRNSESQKNVILRNTSINSLIIDSLYTKGNIFTVHSQSYTISGKDSLVIPVSCLTNSFGLYTDTLYIVNNSQNRVVKIPISANSPFQVVFNGATLNFGSVAVGDSISQALLLGNIFNGATYIDSIYTKSSAFHVTPPSAYLNSLDTLELQIEYKPNSFVTSHDTVYVVNSTLNARLWIALVGASPSPNAILSQSSIAFDTTEINKQASQIIHLTNNSINDLQLESVYTSTEFFTAEALRQNFIIQRGDTADIRINFIPSELGTFLDTLYLVNNSEKVLIEIPIIGSSRDITSVSGMDLTPREYILYQNYPNPFNPTTTINFSIPIASHINLIIYDMLGKEITTLVNEYKSSGSYEVTFDGSNLSSGMYFYRLSTGGFSDTKKLLLVK